LFGDAVDRRQALKGLGLLAVSAPVIVSACSNEGNVDTGSNGGTTGGGAGTTGSAGTTGAGGTTGAAGTNGAGGTPGYGGTTGSGGTGSAGTNGAGGTAAPTGAGGTTGAGGQGGASGAAGTSASGGKGGSGGVSGGGATGTGGSLQPPSFDDVASCTLTATDGAGEGPFFIHEDEVNNDPSIFRQDMRDGKPGLELQLHLRLLDQSMGCNTPIKDVEVYVWHTDALGFYSGFNGQDPNMSYTGAAERTVENGDRFCRGAQVTDANGIVSFRTVYPGWYNGRPIHIHFVALKKGSGPTTQSYRGTQYMIFTTQMYFEEAFSRNIHENNQPYTTRLTGGYSTYVKPNAQSMVRPTMKMSGNVAVGMMNIITNPATSRR
jgi:protocatechuate 3,4-dioxygenase beta subunit